MEPIMNIIETMWLIVVAYAVIQLALLLHSQGQTRLAVAMPLLLMTPIFVGSISAMQDSKQPMLLFLASPLALAYLIFVAYRSLPIPAAMPKRMNGPARFR